MRLTSYNIAVLALKAECCASVFVERMWGYIEEGDTEKEQCAYEKALQLSFLIDTLKRWKPNMSGSLVSAKYTLGTITAPVIAGKLALNGIDIMQYGVLTGTDNEIYRQWPDLFLTCNNPNSDLINVVSARYIVDDDLGEAVEVMLQVSDDTAPLVSSESTFIGSVGGDAEYDVGDSVVRTPYSLSDEQLLSVVEKIQQICTCGC